ncbi:DUF4336 domain-containing protein [Rhodopila globiformis]|nr:DUF4336 domain-containing protein [Rhodopila globiformis]
MIPTWLHGLIDWTVAGLLGGASASRAFSPPVRATLGSAGAYHASYALATDYEAGLVPLLTMRQHLVLDALGGAAILAAGLALRNVTSRERALLVATGLSELAIVALSDTNAGGKPVVTESVAYQPLDMARPVADDVFIVESLAPGALGRVLPARMTVIRLANGDLLLHSPTRYSDALKRQLEGLGRIAHLVAPNSAHWTHMADWQRACPTATTWGVPGLRQRRPVRRSGLHLDFDLGEAAPPDWGDTVDLVMVPGGMGFREAALFHRPSGTLVLTDLVLNLEPAKVPPLMRLIARLFGSTAPGGMPPPYVRAIFKLRRPAATQAAVRLLKLRPERVIFAHGRWFESNGAAELRRSLRWLLDGAGYRGAPSSRAKVDA